MFFREDYKLNTLVEKNNLKKYRDILNRSNNDIKKFVLVLGDYSCYYLFEKIRMDINKDGYDNYYNSWNKAREMDSLDKERARYRKIVYYLLKTSKYDDGYVEDNIEKYTDNLISFCIDFRRLFDFYSFYNNENKDINDYNFVGEPLLNIDNKELIKKKELYIGK